MIPSPLQTAQDLRQAAQNVRDYGHTRREYVGPAGHVCAAGAIGVATGHFIRYTLRSGAFDFVSPPRISVEMRTEKSFDAAMRALSPLTPTACPGECVTHDPNDCTHALDAPCDRADAYHERLAASTSPDRVYHYNDYICEGGEELALLLTQAAEKIEADLP